MMFTSQYGDIKYEADKKNIIDRFQSYADQAEIEINSGGFSFRMEWEDAPPGGSIVYWWCIPCCSETGISTVALELYTSGSWGLQRAIAMAQSPSHAILHI